MTKPPTFVSLFSGCGGMDTGFVQAGYACIAAFDIDRAAVDVHNANLGKTAHVVDLRFATKDQLLQAGRPDVVVAGSPCQGFSTVGRRDLHDPRNSLLLEAGRIALQIQPRIFIAENVSGALSGEHKIYWGSLLSMLAEGGYATTTLVLNASDLGLAQRRSRAILVAWKGIRQFSPPAPNFASTNLRQALDGVSQSSRFEAPPLEPSSIHFRIAVRISQGQKLCNVRSGSNAVHTWDIPEVFGETSSSERAVLNTTLVLRRRNRKRDYGDADPIAIGDISKAVGFASGEAVRGLIKKGYMRQIARAYDLTNTFNGKYRRLHWEATALTVDTKFGDPRFFLHPAENRSFTVPEAARIQGFPDWFDFPGHSRTSFRMIGNAVPPPMARHIADAIRPLLRK